MNGVDEDVAKAYALGIFPTFEDGTVRPELNVMYGEVIRVVCRIALKVNKFLADKHTAVPDYSNIPPTSSHWATKALYSAKKTGISGWSMLRYYRNR